MRITIQLLWVVSFTCIPFVVYAQSQTPVPQEVISANNINRLQQIETLKFDDLVFGASFSKDTLAVSSETSIYLYDINILHASPQLLKPDDATVDIPFVVFSPDGRFVAASSVYLNGDSSIHIWDVKDHSIVATLDQPQTPAGIAFSPDGTKLAGADDKTVYIWDTGNWKLLSSLTSINARLWVAFSPDSTRLAVSTSSNGLHVIEVDTGKEIYADLNVYPTDLSFSANGYGVIFASLYQGVGVVDLEYNGESYLSSVTGQPIDTLALSPDGSLVLTGDRAGQVQLWQIFPNEEFTVTTLEDAYVTDVALTGQVR